jgi:aspartyl-tRNA(Asn)/glutamyl-tRNA(Gln) amidotransferase subunit B
MRVKESSDDYCYFPEPDLPPLHLDPVWIDALRAALPELPAARRARYVDELGLSPYDAAVLVSDEAMTVAFEAIRAAGPELPAKEVANLVAGDYGRALKETAERTPAGLAGRADPASLAHVLREVLAGRLSRANAKEVVADHLASGHPAAEVIAARGYAQISDAAAVGRLVDEAIAANPAAVADFRAGKAQAVGFLVGQVMKATGGAPIRSWSTRCCARRWTAEPPCLPSSACGTMLSHTAGALHGSAVPGAGARGGPRFHR